MSHDIALHTTILRMRQRLAQGDTVRLCRGADEDDSGDLSLEEFEAAFGTAADAEEEKKRQATDRNVDGKALCQEFTEGLQSVPVTNDLGVLKGLLNSLNLSDLIVRHLHRIVQQKLEAGEEMTTDAVHRNMRREDITTALKVCLCFSERLWLVFWRYSRRGCLKFEVVTLSPTHSYTPLLFSVVCLLSKGRSMSRHRETLWGAIGDAPTKPKRCVERKGDECQVCHLVSGV